jgi:hypothetical protein
MKSHTRWPPLRLGRGWCFGSQRRPPGVPDWVGATACGQPFSLGEKVAGRKPGRMRASR